MFQKLSVIFKRKSFRVLALTLLLTFSIASIALALTLSNADGIWDNGREVPSGDTPTCYDEDNSASTTDENQVWYGDTSGSGCPSNSSQSGFGFDGSSSLTFNPGDVFLIGQFVHYNRPIIVNDRMDLVDLLISLSFSDPVLSATFSYNVHLDETPNHTPCAYSGSTTCPDKVDFVNTIPDQTFFIGGKNYTLQIVGFAPGTVQTCQYVPGQTTNQFITEERQNNYACLFGRILVDEPAIKIEKTPDNQLVPSGGTATFNIEVTNIGTITLTNVTVSDALASGCDSVIGTLGPGQSTNYSCNLVSVAGDLTNTAVVTGTSSTTPFEEVSDDDTANVNVQDSSITIIKDSDPDHFRDFQFDTSTDSDTPLDNPFFLDDDEACVGAACDGNQAVLSDTKTFTDLHSGTYTVTETFPGGLDWVTSPISCTAVQASTGGPVTPTFTWIPGVSAKGGTVAIDLGFDQDVTCTFFNIPDNPTAITLNDLSARSESSSVPVALAGGVAFGLITLAAGLFIRKRKGNMVM